MRQWILDDVEREHVMCIGSGSASWVWLVCHYKTRVEMERGYNSNSVFTVNIRMYLVFVRVASANA